MRGDTVHCLILNRNYPPGAGITGASANELAEYLTMQGVKVEIITTHGQYAGAGSRKAVFGQVHYVPAFYNGKNKLMRLCANLIEGFLMARKARELQQAPWICMTDPPLLNFWVGRLASKLNIPWAYWSMDLYPQAFYAAKLVQPKNFIYQFLLKSIKRHQPNLLIALGSKQAEFIQQSYDWSIPCLILPCGVLKRNRAEAKPAWAQQNGKILLGYAGNLGQAHEPEFILELIRQMDTSRFHFILSTYGAKAQALLNLAKKMQGVEILETIPQNQLQFIDVHLTTLSPSWDHVCVPSKAVSSICQEAALLYCGTSTNDNWHLLGNAAWHIDPTGNLSSQVNQFYAQLNPARLAQKKSNAAVIATNLQETQQKGFAAILQFIQGNQKH